MSKYFLLFTILLLLTACVPSQVVFRMAATETQSASPSITPTAIVLPTATALPTATINPCTDRYDW